MGTLIDEIIRQGSNVERGVFLCDSCQNYEGSCSCKKNIFIAFKGANLNHCSFYVCGKKCCHCGRIT